MFVCLLVGPGIRNGTRNTNSRIGTVSVSVSEDLLLHNHYQTNYQPLPGHLPRPASVLGCGSPKPSPAERVCEESAYCGCFKFNRHCI